MLRMFCRSSVKAVLLVLSVMPSVKGKYRFWACKITSLIKADILRPGDAFYSVMNDEGFSSVR